jgi:hypothetical protein
MATWTNSPARTTATQSAVRVVACLVTDDQKVAVAAGESQLFAFDTSERLEGRASRSSAVRAMAIGRVKKFITHGIPNGSTKTISFKRT